MELVAFLGGIWKRVWLIASATLRDVADVVLVDASPVLGLADVAFLASLVNGAPLVVEAGKTGRDALRKWARLLLQRWMQVPTRIRTQRLAISGAVFTLALLLGLFVPRALTDSSNLPPSTRVLSSAVGLQLAVKATATRMPGRASETSLPPTPTSTPTAITLPAQTPTASATRVPTQTSAATVTSTPTQTPTAKLAATSAPTQTPTATLTATSAPTQTPTVTPHISPTAPAAPLVIEHLWWGAPCIEGKRVVLFDIKVKGGRGQYEFYWDGTLIEAEPNVEDPGVFVIIRPGGAGWVTGTIEIVSGDQSLSTQASGKASGDSCS